MNLVFKKDNTPITDKDIWFTIDVIVSAAKRKHSACLLIDHKTLYKMAQDVRFTEQDMYDYIVANQTFGVHMEAA